MAHGDELSEFEKQRLANIAERDALLKKLTSEAQAADIFKTPLTPHPKSSAKKKAPPKRVKKENEATVPRRTSARLAGLTADSEVAKRKAEDEYEAVKRAADAKRMRVSGDLNIGDIVVNGQSWAGIGDDITRKPAAPHMRTFGEEDVKKTTDKELRALRERMNGLRLWQPWEPNRKAPGCFHIFVRSFARADVKQKSR